MQAIIHELSAWVPMDEQVAERLEQLIKNSGHTILGTTDHQFEPQGYTCLWLLAESHAALHTYPEHGVAYIQLSSCSKAMFDSFVVELTTVYNDIDIKTKASQPL